MTAINSSVNLGLPARPQTTDPVLRAELTYIYNAFLAMQAAHDALRAEFDAYVATHP